MAVRPLDTDEAAGLAGTAGDGVVTLAVERDGVVRLVGTMDPGGSATAPDAASIRVVHREADEPGTDVAPLVTALVEAAEAAGARRAVIGWDPMDATGLRVLEGLGFAPVGTMPYFELGPGVVEYVTGYTDATGSILDLARPLG
jgi:hypothetical protein